MPIGVDPWLMLLFCPYPFQRFGIVENEKLGRVLAIEIYRNRMLMATQV
jgi:hypothetical protein